MDNFKKFSLSFSAIIAMALTGCTTSDEPGPSNTIPEDQIVPFPKFALTENQLEINDNQMEFGIRFLADVAKLQKAEAKKENFAVSPMSAAMCMSMLANSVDMDTRSAITETLGCDNLEALNDYYSFMIEKLPFYNNDGILRILNSVWYNTNKSVTPQYESLMESVFHCTPTKADFGNRATIGIINKWASDATFGYIPRIVEDLDPGLSIILANALFYRSAWTYEFDKNKTELKPFHGYSGTVNVPMMHLPDGGIASANIEGTEVAMKTFKNGNAYLFILMPPAEEDIFDFAANLSVDKFREYMHSAKGGIAAIELPRFNMDKEFDMRSYLQMNNISLTHKLSEIGMGNGLNALQLKQRTSIDVNEEGAIVAATTNSMLIGSAGSGYAQDITVNRPFMYFILQGNTNAILIAGIVADLENADTL